MVLLELLPGGAGTAFSGRANTGGGGGAGVMQQGQIKELVDRVLVVVKELNKASGVWSMQSQFQAKSQGTWPDGTTILGVDCRLC